MKNFKKVLPLVLVLILIFIAGCTDNPDNNGNGNEMVVFHEKEFPMILNEDIEITKAFL